MHRFPPVAPSIRCLLIVALFAMLAGCRHDARAPEAMPAPVQVRLLALNDFHGYLEPTPSRAARARLGVDGDVQAGGVVALAGTIERLRAEQPNAIVVAAGDLIGASPLQSALLHDEPSVRALGRMGLDLSSVGNHEFDRGVAELQRIQHGGCPPPACAPGQAPFEGASFTYLAANVFDAHSGALLFPPWEMREFDGVRIAFVGALVRTADQIIVADRITDVRFGDEADAVNAHVPDMLAAGAQAIVLLIHEGAVPGPVLDPETCDGLQGPLLDINARLHPAVTLIVSGHSHREYICRHRGRLITQAGSYGHFVTAIDLELDPAAGGARVLAAENHLVDPARPSADPVYAAIVEDARARSAEIAQQPIARLAVTQIPRSIEPGGESMLGRVIADAQRHAARHHEADLACINPGGVRQHLPASPTRAALTYADVHATQPFANAIVVLEISGAELVSLLEQQWAKGPPSSLLSCSEGFEWAFDASGDRVRVHSPSLDGAPIQAEQRYRFAINEFVANGGDGLTVLVPLPRIGEAGLDLDALIEWLQVNEPLQPPTAARVRGRLQH